MREYIDMCLAIFGLMASVLAVIFVGVLMWAFFIDMPACRNYGKLSGNHVDFALSTGCLVKVDDQWVDIRVLTSKKQELTIRRK